MKFSINPRNMLRKMAGTVQFDIFNTAQCASHQFILLFNMSTYQHTRPVSHTNLFTRKRLYFPFFKFQNKEEHFTKINPNLFLLF